VARSATSATAAGEDTERSVTGLIVLPVAAATASRLTPPWITLLLMEL
jgi:hypothetical protein